MEEMKCVACGETMRAAKKQVQHSFTISGVELRGMLPVDECPACGEALMSCETLAHFELCVAAALAEHGICTGEAFRFIRKALGLRANALATVLGVAPETVSRWEKGQRDVDPHVFAMLAELAIATAEGRPGPAERFKALAAGRPRPATIEVKRAS